MPVRALKGFAKRSGKSMAQAEHDWDHAKQLVKSEYGKSEDDPAYWALVTGITKKMLGLKEATTFKQFIAEGNWDDSNASDANGRWAKYRDGQLGVQAMARWLFSSRDKKLDTTAKLKSCYGAIAQQQNTSKLISAAKADALRGELKKQHGGA